jgi:hypothetical protein
VNVATDFVDEIVLGDDAMGLKEDLPRSIGSTVVEAIGLFAQVDDDR